MPQHDHEASVGLAGSNDHGDVCSLTFDALDVAEISNSVLKASCGATALFIGTTRDSFQGKRVVELRYQSYSSLALKAMLGIVESVRTAHPESELHFAVHHRLGIVPVEQASIVIAVSAPHRRAAFEACEHVLEEVKARAPIWKQEVYAEGLGDAEWKANVVSSQRNQV
ncbi:Molybdopterin synthase catalytic subunit 2 [Exidia glandulosa HHB12029]|uniref:Molybdopterin synthase catalytic subunit 2 n=1 Tax=Exidia glandulosa HHB12029 TaxID=1314781 RepID=A0A165PTM9_EXIGL|nr:Molybdopterin synthase catalytic subunit 2 [Exidia glandulosa HHB12029]